MKIPSRSRHENTLSIKTIYNRGIPRKYQDNLNIHQDMKIPSWVRWFRITEYQNIISMYILFNSFRSKTLRKNSFAEYPILFHTRFKLADKTDTFNTLWFNSEFHGAIPTQNNRHKTFSLLVRFGLSNHVSVLSARSHVGTRTRMPRTVAPAPGFLKTV